MVYDYNVTFANLTQEQHAVKIDVYAFAFYTTNTNYSRSTYKTTMSQTALFEIHPDSETILFSTNPVSIIRDPYPFPSPSPTPTAESAMNASLSESASALNFGNTINFTVSVEGGKAPLTYTWNIEQSSDSIIIQTTTSPYYSSNTFSPGSHHVYVEVRDADNNTAKTLTVEFNVLPLSSSQASPSSSISPVTTPAESLTPEPSQTPDRPKIGDFAPVIIPTSIILLAIVAMGLLIYFRKRRG